MGSIPEDTDSFGDEIREEEENSTEEVGEIPTGSEDQEEEGEMQESPNSNGDSGQEEAGSDEGETSVLEKGLETPARPTEEEEDEAPDPNEGEVEPGPMEAVPESEGGNYREGSVVQDVILVDYKRCLKCSHLVVDSAFKKTSEYNSCYYFGENGEVNNVNCPAGYFQIMLGANIEHYSQRLAKAWQDGDTNEIGSIMSDISGLNDLVRNKIMTEARDKLDSQS